MFSDRFDPRSQRLLSFFSLSSPTLPQIANLQHLFMLVCYFLVLGYNVCERKCKHMHRSVMIYSYQPQSKLSRGPNAEPSSPPCSGSAAGWFPPPLWASSRWTQPPPPAAVRRLQTLWTGWSMHGCCMNSSGGQRGRERRAVIQIQNCGRRRDKKEKKGPWRGDHWKRGTPFIKRESYSQGHTAAGYSSALALLLLEMI